MDSPDPLRRGPDTTVPVTRAGHKELQETSSAAPTSQKCFPSSADGRAEAGRRHVFPLDPFLGGKDRHKELQDTSSAAPTSQERFPSSADGRAEAGRRHVFPWTPC